MASTDAPTINAIDSQHSEAVYPLSVEAGWNQTVADWRFMLQAGHGFGCRGGDGRWQASSLVLPLGDQLAWISMVLVTKARRREGLGTALLRRCIDEVRGTGRVAGLDATEQGRPIYRPLGFRDLYAISRWHFASVTKPTAPLPLALHLRPVDSDDLAALAEYDRAHNAMDRGAVLAHLAQRQPARAWVAQRQSGAIAGFVLGREGRTATSLGPVVADDEAIAIALLEKSAAAADGPFIVDVPAAHRQLRAWLEAQNAVSPRGYVRMTLGDAPGLDDASGLFAIAGPELG